MTVHYRVHCKNLFQRMQIENIFILNGDINIKLILISTLLNVIV